MKSEEHQLPPNSNWDPKSLVCERGNPPPWQSFNRSNRAGFFIILHICKVKIYSAVWPGAHWTSQSILTLTWSGRILLGEKKHSTASYFDPLAGVLLQTPYSFSQTKGYLTMSTNSQVNNSRSTRPSNHRNMANHKTELKTMLKFTGELNHLLRWVSLARHQGNTVAYNRLMKRLCWSCFIHFIKGFHIHDMPELPEEATIQGNLNTLHGTTAQHQSRSPSVRWEIPVCIFRMRLLLSYDQSTYLCSILSFALDCGQWFARGLHLKQHLLLPERGELICSLCLA